MLSGAWFFIITAQGLDRLAKGQGSFSVTTGEGNGQGKFQLFQLMIALSLEGAAGVACWVAPRSKRAWS
jgi:hypothetical protein